MGPTPRPLSRATPAALCLLALPGIAACGNPAQGPGGAVAVPLAAVNGAPSAVVGRTDLERLRPALQAVVLISLISVKTPDADAEKPTARRAVPTADPTAAGAHAAASALSASGGPTVERGWGAGVIVDPSGVVLTNDHLLHHAYRIQVQTADGQRLTARVIGRDPETDIALLRVSPSKPLPAARLGASRWARVGDSVAAVGNPYGLGRVLSVGILGAIGRLQGEKLPDEDMLQTDAPLNPGSSGGPLFNLEGEVIGINTAAVSGGQGLGFAIPIDRIKPVLPDLLQRGRVVRGWLGLDTQDLDAPLRRFFGAPRGGALVISVVTGGPAESAGLVRGDVVLGLGTRPVGSSRELRRHASRQRQGRTVSVKVLRRGETRDLRLQIGEPPTPPLADQITRRPTVGIQGVPMNVPLAQLLELPPIPALLVLRVELGSLAFDAGIRPGDLILEADQRSIHTPEDFDAACHNARTNQRPVVVLVQGKEATRYVALDPSSPLPALN